MDLWVFGFIFTWKEKVSSRPILHYAVRRILNVPVSVTTHRIIDDSSIWPESYYGTILYRKVHEWKILNERTW